MSTRHFTLAELASINAGFPAAVFDPVDVRDEDLDGIAVTNLDVTGWTLQGDGSYGRLLDLTPLQMLAFSAVDQSDSQALTPIEWGEVPADTEIAVDLDRGAFAIHANRSAHTIRFNFTGRGTPITGPLLNRIQKELVAAQTLVKATPPTIILQGTFFGMQDAITTSGWEKRFIVPGPTSGAWKIKRVKVSSADNSPASGNTVLRVSTAAVGGTGTNVDTTLASGDRYSGATSADVAVTTGDTLYAFISTAGGHQNIEFQIELRPSGV